MTTYASPRLTRISLQLLVTIIFLIGLYMAMASTIRFVDYITIRGNETEPDLEPRFPSTSSISVQVLMSMITVTQAAFGIIAITKQQANLLNVYSHTLVISFFIKFMFLIVSTLMHTATVDTAFLTTIPTLALVTATIELVLVMCVCQFARLVKRGDAARQEIQSIHSYHLERRSRSQSRRSLNKSDFNTSQLYLPIPSSPSRSPSALDMSSVTNTDQYGYYVPPPIYLKLDQ